MFSLVAAAALALSALHVLPRPQSVAALACAGAVRLPSGWGIEADTRALLHERWNVSLPSDGVPVAFARDARLQPQGYRLRADDRGISIASADDAGRFYALLTLAQSAHDGVVPCMEIRDAPALRWRLLLDDVSRGPLPTLAYFERRIRIAAAYKLNGYSPYMEHVFASPTDPLPALGTASDGISPGELRTLARYAARFHVALVPQQQTFAHMHETLRVERYAPLAEFPHGYLLSPAEPESLSYVTRLIRQELAATGPVPFFHIGSDETATLGEGATANYVTAHGGRTAVYAQHISDLAAVVAPARAMVWDDGIESDPTILQRIPRNVVIMNWHYGAEPTFEPYIQTIARGGFDQMVDPGARNWNEIFPDLNAAMNNIRRFIGEGKADRVFGAGITVWHDDGETLYEVTWPPVLYAAAASWERGDVPTDRFYNDVASSFYHRASVADDIRDLARIETLLGGTTDKRFWADPFDPAGQQYPEADLRQIRLDAEAVRVDLLHAQTPELRALEFSAARFDALGRRYQIAQELPRYWADVALHPSDAIRDLFWCKYAFWEWRDTDMELAAQFDPVWRFESGEHHREAVRLRYTLDAQTAIRRADAIDRATYQSYVKDKTLPPFTSVVTP